MPQQINGITLQVMSNVISADEIAEEEDSSADGTALGHRTTRAIDYGFLPTVVGYQVRKAYSILFQSFTDTLESIGLAPGQYSALELIALNPGLSQMALADATGMDRTSMVPISNRFAREGWVRRTRRSEDRRVYCLELTPRGAAILAKARPLIEAVERQFAAALSPKEREMARALLARIADSEGSEMSINKPSKVTPALLSERIGSRPGRTTARGRKPR